MKKCTRCRQEKPLQDFYASRLGKYGRKSHCKECADEQTMKKRKPRKIVVAADGCHPVVQKFLMGAV